MRENINILFPFFSVLFLVLFQVKKNIYQKKIRKVNNIKGKGQSSPIYRKDQDQEVSLNSVHAR